MKIVIKRDGKILEQLENPYNTSQKDSEELFEKYASFGPLNDYELEELQYIFDVDNTLENKYSFLHNKANTHQLITNGYVGIIKKV
jgi:hypothetical protein